MIDRAHMMAPVLEACPSFRSQWEAFLEEWASEPELPQYLALGELARHIVALLAAGDSATLAGIFAVVERWHLEGDAYVREAATVGLLEDLQNKNLHTTTSPEQLERFLLPATLKWWRKVERFWSRGEVIADD